MRTKRITLENLRARPKEDRQLIATVSSGAVVAVLLLGWGISSIGMLAPVTDSQTAAVASSDQSVMEQVTKSPDPLVPAYQAPAASPTGVTDTGTVVTIPADSN